MTALERPLLEPPDRVPSFDALGWVLRIAACAVFVGVGLTKFETESLWVTIFARIGLGNWFRYLTGALQVAGGVLFVIPRFVYAAAILTGATMVGAVFVHFFVLHTGLGGAIIPMALLIFITVVTLRKPD